jgi:hypothetical protein
MRLYVMDVKALSPKNPRPRLINDGIVEAKIINLTMFGYDGKWLLLKPNNIASPLKDKSKIKFVNVNTPTKKINAGRINVGLML